MLKEKIREKGKELGFSQVGFTHSLPFEEYKFVLEKLKKINNYPPFVSEDINLRTDPKLIMENCKTIIAVAFPYVNNVKLSLLHPPAEDEGYISPSAWGLDYHILVKDKMEELVQFIDRETKGRYQFMSFVDTGHLSDREIAKRAGIGFVGKNSSLITKEMGSFVWLGHILTDLELAPDSVMNNLDCGHCNLCIQSCPTNAIKEDGFIDYSKCLANVLVQKGELSLEIREKMNKRIYGCDTCQLVCPKNMEVLKKHSPSYASLGWIKLRELLELSNKSFKSKYGNTAFSWRGKGVLSRNAKVIIEKNSKTVEK
ncbi:tRNA epoxyqueuosine(34) reductase QueG [Anaerobranca gottschalkii]|uniref:Epoxyqueuosine reductase n=1 Tax=Anaerobranca gottschalkii DSM 13577 TaxID=1120990 RepID=A0A1I0AFH9_9FIRM|nr:tRNA epoxyqueuosine(34) reductase QueG [Anaerobranca gottschalkii]SES92944.1 epoxyqueuosine reductase [Anaerobranca gottschalkii DSM 13577]